MKIKGSQTRKNFVFSVLPGSFDGCSVGIVSMFSCENEFVYPGGLCLDLRMTE